VATSLYVEKKDRQFEREGELNVQLLLISMQELRSPSDMQASLQKIGSNELNRLLAVPHWIVVETANRVPGMFAWLPCGG
jgi:hypothetical protein